MDLESIVKQQEIDLEDIGSKESKE